MAAAMTWTVTCWFCNRDVEEALTVLVNLATVGLVTVCHECVSRGEEAADIEEGVAA